MKRFLKLSVSLAVHFCDVLFSTVAQIFGRTRPGTCAVLYYHEVVEPDRARFAAQLDVICRNAKSVDALDPDPFAPGKRHVAITVDDAFISFFQNGLPELEKRNIPALVFVPTAWLGKKVDWAMEEVMTSPNERVATLDELKHHAKHPLVRLGSHTCNHRKLNELTDAEATLELAESKEFLQREFGKPVESVSFPYGGFSARILKLAAKAGYTRFFSTSPVIVEGRADAGLIGRFRVDPSDWLLEVKLKTCGAYRWQSKLQHLRARLRGGKCPASAGQSAACSV